ncbi:hypothetical protein [Stenotrophomonas sp. TWI819]|uniref:hypothetical protein n=1 Tax=Stenotrophomonas sp. TWI819 TaxID=3136800 RepID=UPI00320891FA
MKTQYTLLTAMLLGGIVISMQTMASEPVSVDPPELAVDDSELPSDAIAVAADASATDDAAVAPAAPAWEHLIPITAQLQTDSGGQPIGAKSLRLVQRSTTAKVAGAQVAMSLLSGRIAGSSFGKGQLKGTRIESVVHPAFGPMQAQVRTRLDDYFKAHPGAVPTEEKPVQATLGDFILVYQELDDSQTLYELRQSLSLGFPYRRKLPTMRLTGGEGAQCNVTEPVAAPLEAWQADDYAMVKQTVQRYADDCLVQFVATLPTLFPDKHPVTVNAPSDTAEPADAGNPAVPEDAQA